MTKLYPKSMRVRLTDDEHNRIRQHAKQAGLSISRYLIENALTKPMTSEQREQYQVLTFQRDWAINEVARVGNNINQNSTTTQRAKGQYQLRSDPDSARR